MKFTADAKVPSMKLRANLAGLLMDRMSAAITAFANMAASMIEELRAR